jgi:hypothetical protein
MDTRVERGDLSRDSLLREGEFTTTDAHPRRSGQSGRIMAGRCGYGAPACSPSGFSADTMGAVEVS